MLVCHHLMLRNDPIYGNIWKDFSTLHSISIIIVAQTYTLEGLKRKKLKFAVNKTSKAHRR